MALSCGGSVLCRLLLSLCFLLPLTQSQSPATTITFEQVNGSTAWNATPENCYSSTDWYLIVLGWKASLLEHMMKDRGMKLPAYESQHVEFASENSTSETANLVLKRSRCKELLDVLSAILEPAGETLDDFYWAEHSCLRAFENQMEIIEASQWCNWTLVMRPYSDLSDCTERVMEFLGSYWPNEAGKRLLMLQHDRYFRDCVLPQPSLMHPPKETVLALTITPICIIPIMVGLAVWYNRGSDSQR